MTDERQTTDKQREAHEERTSGGPIAPDVRGSPCLAAHGERRS